MAYYKITVGKRGRLKAKIQAYGKDISGERRLYTKTVYNEDDLTESKFKKFIERMSSDFEDEIEEAYKSGVRNLTTGILTFPQLMSEWISTIRANLSESYYLRARDVEKRFNEYLTEKNLFNRPLNEIHVRDIQLFLNGFSERKAECTGTACLKQPLPKKVNFRELDRLHIIDRCASYKLNNVSGNVSLKTAEAICDYYDLEFDKYFQENFRVRQYAQETVKGYRRILRAVFNEAVRFEWISKNPVCGTKVAAGSGNSSLKPIGEKAVFSIKETQEFLKALDELPEEFINKKIMIKLMLLTGIRCAELHGLRWTDVDFQRKMLRVQRNRLYSPAIGVYEKTPKTKTSEREIPLSDSLVDELKAYEDWFRIADDDFDAKRDQYYLACSIKREPENPRGIATWLRNFEQRNGFKAVSCHGLRHTYCSLLLSKNVPIQTVSKYMGHSDSSITLQVYSHFIPDTQERVISALNSIINPDEED